MTLTLGTRRLCLWWVGIQTRRDAFDWAWHGRKINPTWRLTLLGLHVELRRDSRPNVGRTPAD